MNTLTLNYNGLPLHANREAWFNATEIAAMFGKRPIDWLRLPETERYIAALCKREAEKQQIAEVRKSHFIKTRKGGNDLTQQGTWLHPKLAVAFARWCDIDFALWCDEQIETLIREGKDHQSSRQESSIAYRIMGEILQAARKAEGKDTQPHHYRNEALLCNAALTGQFTAIARDSLDKLALNMLTRLQAHNAALIGQGIPYPKQKNIGIFRFEIGKIQGRGRPEKFAMLNEDQFIFSITLSRNTPQAVAAKQAIVKAFAAARRLINAQAGYLDAYHELHDTAAQMEAAAQQRGSSAPKGACPIWLEKLNNKLGIPAHSRLNKKQKQLLAVLCGIEKAAAYNILRQGGNEKQAYQAAKQAAQDFIRQYATTGRK